MHRHAICVLLTVALSASADDDAEKAARRMVDASQRTVAVLKSVTDKDSAQRVKKELARLGTETEDALKALMKLPAEKSRELEVKYRPQLEPLLREVETQVNRIEKDAALKEVLADIFPLSNRQKAKFNAARLGARTLDQALQVYQLKNGTPPKSLNDLAVKQPDGGGAYIEARALNDPWGNPYQYDPNGPQNKGEKPDVWSLGPPGAKMPIGNWPSK